MRKNIKVLGLIAILSAAVAAAAFQSKSTDLLRTNAGRLEQRLQELSRFGKNAQGGVDRTAFSDADIQARAFVISLMRSIGLETRIDAVGNIIGRTNGAIPNSPPILMGSHIDSVPNGGMYDGALGVLAAIECVQVIKENAISHRSPLEVIVFSDEEGGAVGSKAMAGDLTAAVLDSSTLGGKTVREGIKAIGGDPDLWKRATRVGEKFKTYLELHIEQGGRLAAKGAQIGIVEGIVAIRRWNVVIDGESNHSGTTPMEGRKDALLAASHFVVMVNKVVTSFNGEQVGTVGRFQVEPGAPNVIPGHVALTLELRDMAESKINIIFGRIMGDVKAIEQMTGTAFSVAPIQPFSNAAPTDKNVSRCIDEAAKELTLTTLWLPSGAGHDAQNMARLAPMGMIFIPSQGGISHSPREFSKAEDIANGANLLLQTVLRIDRGCF